MIWGYIIHFDLMYPQLEGEKPAGGRCSNGRGERERARPGGDRRGGPTHVGSSSLAGRLFESQQTTGQTLFLCVGVQA